jgi:hypothetical protein
MHTPELALYYVNRPPPLLEGHTLSTYFPSLEILFPSIAHHTSGNPSLASIELATEIQGISGTVENLLDKTKRTVPVWIKKMHIVEPLSVMDGTYILPHDGALPTFRAAWQSSLRKLNDPYNEAYTDAVFACMASRLVELGISPHWCRFYGTYVGRTPEYQYNLTEDFADIQGEEWFQRGIETNAFRVIVNDPYNKDVSAPLEQTWKILPLLPRSRSVSRTNNSDESEDDMCREEETSNTLDAAELLVEDHPTTLDVAVEVEDITASDTIELAGTVELVRPRLKLTRVSGSEHSQHTSSEEEDELEYRAVFKDFPVQITILERCDGTMDDLMEYEISHSENTDLRETKEQRWTAWMFQIIAGLTVAQQTYDFVHNDLHTNNIMWCGTGDTHLYYSIQGASGGDRYYRIPTYGRMFKIIDFGRATFRPSDKKHTKKGKHAGRIWFPDAFAPGADAGGQYNYDPFYDSSIPKVAPNKSFDLSRLAVAMLESLWEDIPKDRAPAKILTKEPGRIQHETISPLWNMMWLWLTDKYGKNILRTPDGEERYPHFNLYCAIARDIHNAVPGQQITLPIFDSAFKIRKKDIPTDAHVWVLHAQNRC